MMTIYYFIDRGYDVFPTFMLRGLIKGLLKPCHLGEDTSFICMTVRR